MRTIITETKVYKFDELTEEHKQKAIEKLWDINVDFDWWQSVYEDAANIGLKITGFDIYRGAYCKGDFMLSAAEVAQNILNNHGESCETYKTAAAFMEEWQPVFNEYMDENSPHYESGESEDKLMEIEEEFKKSLLEDYRIILQHEYEYLTSEQAILEMIEANDYEFDEEGNIA